MRNSTWIISNMVATTQAQKNALIFFANSLKEYEIIKLIYNRKTLDLL